MQRDEEILGCYTSRYMTDKYKNFTELSTATKNYKIDSRDFDTEFIIVAPHGGNIEPTTDLIAKMIASEKYSYYLFLGGTRDQHITSSHFDEPKCLELISKAKKVITIHGKKGIDYKVMLGGLDDDLIIKGTSILTTNGFEVIPSTDNVAGKDKNNICNKGSSGKGLQIEMGKELRDSLKEDSLKLKIFSDCIRKTIE